MKNKQAFAKYMTLLAEIHNKDISTSLLEVYWKTLEPYDDQVADAAFNRIVLTLRFFPKPVDIIEAVNHTSGDAPSSSDRAAEQVSIVMKQIRELGSYRTPAFDDPVTRSLMASRWSWPSVCSMTEAELKWWAKEFSEAYQASERLDPQMNRIECNTPRLKLLAGGIGR